MDFDFRSSTGIEQNTHRRSINFSIENVELKEIVKEFPLFLISAGFEREEVLSALEDFLELEDFSLHARNNMRAFNEKS